MRKEDFAQIDIEISEPIITFKETVTLDGNNLPINNSSEIKESDFDIKEKDDDWFEQDEEEIEKRAAEIIIKQK